MATLALVISTVGLVVAGISAIGTVTYAFITQAARTEAKSAAASVAASAEATKASAEATKRLADYAEAELAVLRQQLEEERERNRPTVQTKVLMGHVAQRGRPEVLTMIRFVTTNIGRAADVLTGIEVRFGRRRTAVQMSISMVVCTRLPGTQCRPCDLLSASHPGSR